MSLTLVSSNKCFSGEQRVYSHLSQELKCEMKFSVYLPQAALEGDKKVPVLYFLSGLTCNESNFVTKAGAQRLANEHSLIIVCPDTSPRGLSIAGEEDSWDFGSGAGFYVDATEAPWAENYRMFSYVTKELIETVNASFPSNPDKLGVFGHSMGGHGALICSLKNPGLFKSVSAFAPICNPTQCPWGEKAFSGYLGAGNREAWKAWDATELVKGYQGPPLELFLDQGSADNFLTAGQLLPNNLVEAAREAHVPCILKMREGYDHSYFYIATFVQEHIEYHAKLLAD